MKLFYLPGVGLVNEHYFALTQFLDSLHLLPPGEPSRPIALSDMALDDRAAAIFKEGYGKVVEVIRRIS
jgi:hypothetical protein